MVWKIDDVDAIDFIKTGRMGVGAEPVLPYDPAVMEAVAKGHWSVGDGE